MLVNAAFFMSRISLRDYQEVAVTEIRFDATIPTSRDASRALLGGSVQVSPRGVSAGTCRSANVLTHERHAEGFFYVEMSEIKCRCCGETKPEEQFYLRKETGRRRTECKACWNARAAKWVEKNPERSREIKKAYEVRNQDQVRASRAAWKRRNREKINEQQRDWRSRNRQRCIQYGRVGYAKHRDAARQRTRSWYRRNRDYALQWATEYAKRPDVKQRISARKKERTKTDPAFAINQRMRGRLRQTLLNLGGKANRSWTHLVGYTATELHAHLEAQFVKGMSWANMHLWEIDHIVALADFDVREVGDSEFRAAWSLGNLRPTWRSVNRRKSAKREFLL